MSKFISFTPRLAHNRVGRGTIWNLVLSSLLPLRHFRRILGALRDDWWNSTPRFVFVIRAKKLKYDIIQARIVPTTVAFTAASLCSCTTTASNSFFLISPRIIF